MANFLYARPRKSVESKFWGSFSLFQASLILLFILTHTLFGLPCLFTPAELDLLVTRLALDPAAPVELALATLLHPSRDRLELAAAAHVGARVEGAQRRVRVGAAAAGLGAVIGGASAAKGAFETLFNDWSRPVLLLLFSPSEPMVSLAWQ